MLLNNYKAVSILPIQIKFYYEDQHGIDLHQRFQDVCVSVDRLRYNGIILEETHKKFHMGNLGIAVYDVDGQKELLMAHSKIKNSTHPLSSHLSFVFEKSNRRYQTLELNDKNQTGPSAWDRKVDAESKIVEELAARFIGNLDAPGDVYLFTKLEVCPSCNGVLNSFSADFKNLNITVYFRY